MKMTNEQLQVHIDALKTELHETRNEAAELGFKVSIQDMIDEKVTEASITANKKFKEVEALEDRIRHAEGWLDQRRILRGVKAPKAKTQRIGDLMREKLTHGA